MIYINIFFSEIYKIIFLLLPVLVSVALIVWLDRRVWAFVQKRRGPNVVGPFGLFQTLADALKYIFKEIIIPASANKTIFVLAPIITMTLALAAWAVIPFSNVNQLRESINKHIQKKISNNSITTNSVHFVESDISIKAIDYYYTNPIARSSKVMNECRKISKKFLFTGIEKAS